MLSLTDEMKREIIMDHYSNPNNKNKPQNMNDYKQIRMDSDSCIDDITIYLKVENDKIIDALFDGIACAISTSSTDILCDLIKGKSYKDALYIIEQYQNMLFEKEYDASVLDELIVFSETYKQAARIKCANIGADVISKIIYGDNNE